jgi:signal transduction histidine kinase
VIGFEGAVITAVAGLVLIVFTTFLANRLLRSRRSGLSIRMQLFIALALLVSAFALGLGLLVLNRIDARATSLAQDAARDEAVALAALFEGELERGEPLASVAARLDRPTVAAAHVTLLDAAGRDTRTGAAPAPLPGGTLAVAYPVTLRGELVGSVRVVKPTITIGRTLVDFTPAAVVTGVALMLLAAACAAFIGRTIARPIEALTSFAVRVSEGERRAPPPPALGREVQQLSRAIDSMRRELEGRPFVETFAADLSHELKNPVAAIRASAEVLADGALEEPEEAERFVARIREATSRIEVLLGDLLSLARIEARGVEDAAVVDLADLAARAVARAAERGDPIELAVDGAPHVRGDRLWLARAVDNLLDNARTHGDGRVRVEVRREGALAVLAVANGGAIGPYVEKRLFRRFVTTRADRGGTGLGLAIVRAIAEAHSGSAECTKVGPPEVELRITLPAA